jgi:hypothetical protein
MRYASLLRKVADSAYSSFSLIWLSSCPLPSSVSRKPNSSLIYTQADSHVVGWTGPYPTLSRKRPTADLVSRKVLTPLLGQIALVVLGQLVIFKIVQLQPW